MQKIKIYRSITEVNAGQWDAIVDKDRVFCALAFLDTINIQLQGLVHLVMATLQVDQ